MANLLKIRSHGESVREVTQLFIERGYLAIATSVFDTRVRAAVEEFKSCHVDPRGHPLHVDDKVGDRTWWTLRHADNTEIPSAPVDTEFYTITPGGRSSGARSSYSRDVF